MIVYCMYGMHRGGRGHIKSGAARELARDAVVFNSIEVLLHIAHLKSHN